MKKIIVAFVITMLTIANPVFANMKPEINKVILNSGINQGSISISVKNVKSGKTVYEMNPTMPVPPASTQKIITATPAFITLGQDYRFTTALYKNNSGDYIIKLGANPYLSTKDLEKIVKFIDKEPKSISVDASVIDSEEWGEGWQWDDNINPYMPKFSAYNIDGNIIEFVISPTVVGFPSKIIRSNEYPITIINNIITDKTTSYTIKCKDYVSPDTIVLDGKIKSTKSEFVKVPVNCPKKYFNMRLSEAVINHNISSNGIFNEKRLDDSYKLITLLSQDTKRAEKDIFKNSNNMVTETVFKLAGGKYSSSTGSFNNGRLMFYDFCEKHHLDTTNIKIVDASGVSKNNLMITDFMTDFLMCVKGYLEPELPTAGEGTLSGRMLYLKDCIHAKTGTLDNISSIAGYITSKKGNEYVFSIMIKDSKTKSADKKMLEEYILRAIYIKG